MRPQRVHRSGPIHQSTNRRTVFIGLHRLKQGAFDKVLIAEQFRLQASLFDPPAASAVRIATICAGKFHSYTAEDASSPS